MRGKGKRPSRLSTSPYVRNKNGSMSLSAAASRSENGPSTSSVTAPAVASGGNIVDDKDKANLLNEYFCRFTNIDDSKCLFYS